MTTPKDVTAFARRLRASGMTVIPMKEDGSKSPDAGKWGRWQNEHVPDALFEHWFGAEEKQGIAVLMGAASGNLELLDFDCMQAHEAFLHRAGEVGLIALVERIANGYSEATPNGVHFFYRVADPITLKLARRDMSDEEIVAAQNAAIAKGADPLKVGTTKTTIETKGEGGYSICHPSHGKVHETGLAYRLIKGGPETVVTLTEEEHKDLLDLCRSFDVVSSTQAIANEHTSTHEPRTPGDRVRPGDDFARHSSWADVLEPHGWTQVYTMGDGTTHWRRPGKSHGTSATTNHGGYDIFYVFTSSTAFDPMRGYGKFSAYAHLEHGGDFKRAAVMLREGGYGEGLAAVPNNGVDLSNILNPKPKPPVVTGTTLAERRGAPTGASLVSDLTAQALELVRARSEGRELPVPTPFPTLTESLSGGYWPGVHFLVGGTGVGKTVLTTQIAFHAAEQGHAVAIAPIEMGQRETVIRLCSEAAGVFWSDLMTGKGSADALWRFEAAIAVFDSLPIIVDKMAPNGWSGDQLDALCRRAVELAQATDNPKTPLIIVDFVQIMGANEGEKGDLRERIRSAAYTARQHAVDHGCAILMVSSVSRAAYKLLGGDSKALAAEGVSFQSAVRPGFLEAPERAAQFLLEGAGALVGLGKESGELEYSATTVSVIAKLKGGVGLAIAKQRYGVASWVPLTFNGGRYSEASQKEATAMIAASQSAPNGASQTNTIALRRVVLDVIGASPGCGAKRLREDAGARLKAKGHPISAISIDSMAATLAFEGKLEDRGSGKERAPRRWFISDVQEDEIEVAQ